MVVCRSLNELGGGSVMDRTGCSKLNASRIACALVVSSGPLHFINSSILSVMQIYVNSMLNEIVFTFYALMILFLITF